MRDMSYSARLSRRMVEFGCPETHARRMARELTEHRDDLVAAAIEEGCAVPEAEKLADERLGAPESLADQLTLTLRRSSWWGRHPVIGFCLLPPFATLLAWFIGLLLMAGVWTFLITEATRQNFMNSPDRFRFIAAGLSVLFYTGVAVVPCMFLWLSVRFATGLKWVVTACLVSGLHGAFANMRCTPHAFMFGYANRPHWGPVIAPVLIALFAILWRRFRKRRLELDSPPDNGLQRPKLAGFALLLGLASLLATGCSSNKVAKERGWIGGEYKIVSSQRILPGTNQPADATTKKAEHARTRGLLITRLGTNAPASIAGLREGDLILKMNDRLMNHLRDFRDTVDAAKPGTSLQVNAWRDGQPLDLRVTAGREKYKDSHMVAFGSFLGGLDLWPNPDFSLVAVSYRHNKGRMELDSPDMQFRRKEHPTEKEFSSPEGWNLWLGVLGFGGFKTIIEQSPAEDSTASTARPGLNLPSLVSR